MDAPIAAALVDVGGTLWPEQGPVPPGADELRAARLRRVMPALSPARCLDLLRELEVRAAALDDALTQDSDRIVGDAAAALGLTVARDQRVALRRAICLPASGSVTLLPGAHDLLATIKRLGLRCVLVTNVAVRDRELSRQDFTDLGVSAHIDEIVTSHDVGFRKPHPAIFHAATRAAGCAAERCVMIGNRERIDIEPAVALGMRALLVAIEDPVPATTAGHAVAGTLHEAAAILTAWVTRTPPVAPALP